MSNTYLVINIIIWFITLLLYFKIKRNIDSGFVILASFFIYSISSLIAFNSTQIYNELKIFPFIYLYLMIVLFIYPVLKNYNSRNIIIEKPNKKLFYSIAILYMTSSILFFIFKINGIYEGILNIISNPSAGADIYRDTMDNSYDVGDGIITNVFAIISNIFSDIGILLFFYYLTLKNKNKYILIGLSFSIIASIFAPIAQSQRGPAVDRLLTVIIAYFTLKDFIPYTIKKRIKTISLVVVVIFTIPIAAITISRFEHREGGAKGSVFLYTGMQNLNFNNYAFDNGGLRYGDRTFPLFKRILGYEDVPFNFWERRYKYPNLKINDEVFIGFVGDFVLDFGPWVAAIIFIVFSINTNHKTRIRNKTLQFHQLILLYFVMCVSIQGGIKLFSFSDTGGNLKLIAFLLVYILFKFDYIYSRQIKNYN
ncbi:O-antigen polymerase [Proteiniphilum propionicum]|uniref:O-antigen polymerase n=1 Tax=Proteiniphilum propionicum TaxID=2829812 RepID=UPI001EEA6420|nr:O-antigen polymerase [Proteiniphilum propionicum]ULB33520.1 oligosaccharide repeat unit polymerase [Proteiniphilum propionicum]